MLYDEFLKGCTKNGKQPNQNKKNYELYNAYNTIYMNSNLSKEEIYKQAKKVLDYKEELTYCYIEITSNVYCLGIITKNDIRNNKIYIEPLKNQVRYNIYGKSRNGLLILSKYDNRVILLDSIRDCTQEEYHLFWEHIKPYQIGF